MPTEAVFVDREAERGALDSLVASARQSKSGALVLYGDAGMGKTVLLDYASSAQGFHVVRMAGIETEQTFGFGALHRLLLPFNDVLDQLPTPQQLALEAAFGLREKGPSDRFMVGLAALSVLAAESAKGPLLCVIDDAQWIDTESLLTLGFVSRRIRAEGIVLLFGVRTALGVPTELTGIPSMEIGGLPLEAASDILTRSAGRPLGTTTSRRIVMEMNGCPLALWELGKELADTYQFDQRLPMQRVTLNHRLEEHFFRQIANLSSEIQLLLLVAAADTSGNRALVERVARELGGGVNALLAAENQHILLPGDEIRFRHPLIRSTVYARADPDRLRLVHRTLAASVGKDRFPDRWARHVALGAEGPSEKLASELEEMSQVAQARGGYGAQTTLLMQAANLSVSVESRSARLLGAANAAMHSGAHPFAVELLDQVEPYLSEPTARAEAQHLRGLLAIGLAQPSKAPALLLSSARSFLPLSTSRAREILMEAFDAYAVAGPFTTDISPHDIAALAETTKATARPFTFLDRLLGGTTALFGGNRSEAYAHYRQAREMIRTGEVTDDQLAKWNSVGLMTMDMYDDSTYNLWARRRIIYARNNGALHVLLYALIAQITADIRSGQLRAAADHHAEALDVAAASGQPAEYHFPDDIVRAWAGDEEGARRATAEMIELHTAVGSGAAVVSAHYSSAVLHIGAARYDEALAETDFICAQNMLGWTAVALPLRVEAAVKTGDIEKAQAAEADLEARATMSGTPWGLGLMAQSKALLSDGTQAEKYFQEAIHLLQQTTVETDLARTRLLYGEWLRRQKRRKEARSELSMALVYFAEMGAAAFARRAETELLATGLRARARSIDHSTDLTIQEQRVAELAADGLTNREIAAQLFISNATVEYHLHNVFGKLGISSRGRLAAALRSGNLALT